MSLTIRMVYANSSSGGSSAAKRAAGQIAVADLAAGGAAHELHFTDRERREVVVEHEALEGLAFEVFDLLRFLRRAEGHGDERLRLAAGEDGRAVRTREDGRLDRDRPDLVERAAIDAAFLFQHEVAEDLHFHLAPSGADGGEALGVIGRNRSDNLRFERLQRGIARVLAGRQHGFFELRAVLRHQLAHQLFGELGGVGDFELRLAGFGAELELQRAEAADLGVRGLEGVEDDALVDFARAGFDHDDRVRRTGHDEVEVAEIALRVGRVDDELAVDVADADGRDRIRERNLGDHQRRGGGVDGEDIGIVLAVSGENQGDDLRLLPVALRKRWAEGTVDETAGENFLLGGTAFAFEKAARDAAAGVGVLLVVDGEGHEVAEDGAFFVAGRGEDDRVAVADHARAVGLTCDRTGLERKRTPADLELFLVHSIPLVPETTHHLGAFDLSAGGRTMGSSRRGLRVACHARKTSGALSCARLLRALSAP